MKITQNAPIPPEGGGKFPRLSWIKEIGVTEKIRQSQPTKAAIRLQIVRMPMFRFSEAPRQFTTFANDQPTDGNAENASALNRRRDAL